MVMRQRDIDRPARAARALAMSACAGDTGEVKTSLDHLPEGKRRELELVVEILTQSFAQEISTRASKHLNQAKILKIILFGSYARGDWVEDPVGRYFSDYDLLVVVEKEKLTDIVEFWEGAEQTLLAELSDGRRLRTPVNFIVHTLDEINEQLSLGRYFFTDIVHDGILLLDVPGYRFDKPLELSKELAVAEAQSYYEKLLPKAAYSIIRAKNSLADGESSFAAFDLHQAAEQAYNCLLLVLTLYAPKSHNLVRLRNLSEPLVPSLLEIWPTDTKFHKRCFELLRAAYVKARYSSAFEISRDELAWIEERVTLLLDLVTQACQARISGLGMKPDGDRS